MPKFTYKLNKPAKVVNQKSGYVSTQETTPNNPITIWFDGEKMLDVRNQATLKDTKTFAKILVEILNDHLLVKPRG